MPAKSIAKPAPQKVTPPSAKPVQNKLTMREAVAQLVSKKALVISEIVEGMKRAGYVFKSSNPTNSVGAFLYGSEGKKTFKRVNGKFSMKK